MTNYIKPGEVYRNIERKKRAEAAGCCLKRIADVLTGIAVGFLLGAAIYMIR